MVDASKTSGQIGVCLIQSAMSQMERGHGSTSQIDSQVRMADHGAVTRMLAGVLAELGHSRFQNRPPIILAKKAKIG
jgi:hypothetical protein